MQPTSPPLQTSTINDAINYMLSHPEIDTLISARETTHLTWRYENGQAVFTIVRITVFEAKIAQAREWTESSQGLPNPLPNPLPNSLPNPLPEILILMQANPRITYTELAARLHVSRESIRKHIKALREKHKLIFRQGGPRGIWITHTESAE